ELELEQLVGDNQVVGGITPTIIPATISFVGVTFTVTLNAGACPTSGCTKSCNK
ncbi:TPA: class II lanthipeptide, LchA2/BrtA2 family, partial [Streptococcus pneumoniae]